MPTNSKWDLIRGLKGYSLSQEDVQNHGVDGEENVMCEKITNVVKEQFLAFFYGHPSTTLIFMELCKYLGSPRLYLKGTRAKRPECESYHPPSPSVQVNNERCFTSTPP